MSISTSAARLADAVPRSRLSANGIRWACCSATHSRVRVEVLKRRWSHQQLLEDSRPARMARTLLRFGDGRFGGAVEFRVG